MTPEAGGFAPNAYGARGGVYLSRLMDGIDAPLASRWASILLRRLILSATDTPSTINGADLAASRAGLLLRLGESRAARMIVQSIDTSRATPRLRIVALNSFAANADPGGMCPHVPFMVFTREHDPAWNLAQAACHAMESEAGPATALIERARRRSIAPRIDVILAEKVVGAGPNSRRSVRVQWDDVNALTGWRFGMATATGVTIPDNLMASAPARIRLWSVQAPMIPVETRLRYAPEAAVAGVLSSRAYVALLSYAAAQEEPADAVTDQGALLRRAYVGATATARIEAITALASASTGGDARYAGLILSAYAAARIAPVEASDAELRDLLGAMFAAGLDRNAIGWVRGARVGSQSWGLLAVGSPRPLVGIDAGMVNDFADSDDSGNQQRTRLLAAGLIGLGRLTGDDATELAESYNLGLGRQSRWTRAIVAAAERGESGTVTLLTAVGLSAGSWADLPPHHLYHITAALRRVGLGAEARMIAAEAVTRS